jgi:predicted alpha/beta-hydrolase family hydrolase
MRLFAGGLAARGLDTMTFNFQYTEQGRRSPDPTSRLESCYAAVIKTALEHKKLKHNRLVIGGKSMGGRIGSQVAGNKALVDDWDDRLAGLVFLGYPLHPPGKPEQPRDKHLKDIHAPMLFVQGTRDAFGTPDELREVITRLRIPATLHLIDGGDHSFKVPKSSGLSQEQVYESAMDEIVSWLEDKSHI